MTKHPKIRTLEELRDLVFTFRIPRILLSALELKLFSVMGRTSWTIQALSKRLGASERGVDILCRNLASAGILLKKGTRYQNSKFGQTFLNSKSPHYRGAYLDLIQRQWEDWSQLSQSIRTGKPVEGKEPETPKYRRSFSWAMHQRSVEPAKQVARQLNLKQARSLLDLGGGPGTYALEFLAINSKLQATVMDRQAALEVAKKIAGTCQHGKRLSYQEGDFFKSKIKGFYDIIWVSNVIHIYSPLENTKLFKKLLSHLHPKGRIIIQDTFLKDQNGLYPQETNLFAVTMLLFTDTGNTYKAIDVHGWLKTAGFKSPKNITLKKGTGDWEGVLIQGTKP